MEKVILGRENVSSSTATTMEVGAEENLSLSNSKTQSFSFFRLSDLPNIFRMTQSSPEENLPHKGTPSSNLDVDLSLNQDSLEDDHDTTPCSSPLAWNNENEKGGSNKPKFVLPKACQRQSTKFAMLGVLCVLAVTALILATAVKDRSSSKSFSDDTGNEPLSSDVPRTSSLVPTSGPTLTPTSSPSLRPTPRSISIAAMDPQPTKRPTSPPVAARTPRPTPRPTAPVTFVPGDLTVRQAGLRLSTGLKAQVIAMTGQRVIYANGERSSKSFHAKPDFGGVFPQANGNGWIYVSNSEVEQNRGGVGALTFNQQGKVIDYKMLLTGTSKNCGGGKTPWNTWISCEETEGGSIWQVDPTGQRPPYPISVGSDGGGEFESFAYDQVKGEYFVTEDDEYGPLRRWIPSAGYNNADPWLTLHGAGETTYLQLLPESSTGGTYEWISNKEQASYNANMFYPNAEGIDVYGRRLYFVSKEIKMLFVLNLNNMQYTSHSTRSGLFDGEPDQLISVLNNKNNNNNQEEELLFFTEDGGKLAGVHACNRRGQCYTILESDGSIQNDETTGLAFSPDYRFMYVAYQKTGILVAISRQDGLPFTAKSLNVKYHATYGT